MVNRLSHPEHYTHMYKFTIKDCLHAQNIARVCMWILRFLAVERATDNLAICSMVPLDAPRWASAYAKNLQKYCTVLYSLSRPTVVDVNFIHKSMEEGDIRLYNNIPQMIKMQLDKCGASFYSCQKQSWK